MSLKQHALTAHVYRLARANRISLAVTPFAPNPEDTAELERQRAVAGADMIDLPTFASIVGSCAYVEQREICLTPDQVGDQVSPVQYAVVLHEIGHIVHPEGCLKPRNECIQEIAAWEWALGQAHVWDLMCHYALMFGIEQRLYGIDTANCTPETEARYVALFKASHARIAVGEDGRS